MTPQISMAEATGDCRWDLTWPRRGTQEAIILGLLQSGQIVDTETCRQYYGIPNLQQVVYRLRKHHHWPVIGRMARHSGVLRKQYAIKEFDNGRTDGIIAGSGGPAREHRRKKLVRHRAATSGRDQ